MTWAFVDYENTGSLESINLADYERVFVFCGPKHSRITFGAIPTAEFCRVELIRVSTTGKNNLDFHLVFYLGRFDESTSKDIAFHLISNDQGFDGLVSHLTSSGRKCKRIATKLPATKQPATKPPAKKKTKKARSMSLSEKAKLVASRLETNEASRPQTRPKLLNWIKTQCNGNGDGIEPESILAELRESGLVQESEEGHGIAYQFQRS